MPETEIHYSVSALASVLSEGAKKYKGIDERPIETLLTFALNATSWLGSELFGFPEGLNYRTQNIRGLADVAGFSPDREWTKGSAPVAQLEFKRDAQMNLNANGYQFDWYASNHGAGDHLTVLLPESRRAIFQRDMDELVDTSERWTIVTFEEALERLTSRGVAELPEGQARELLLTMIRAQGI